MEYRLLILVLLGFTICFPIQVDSVKCEYCNKDFNCLPKHTWRHFRSIPQSTRSDTNLKPEIVEKDSQVSNSNNTNNLGDQIECQCGKKCNKRRGLRLHQRKCKLHEKTNDCVMQTPQDIPIDSPDGLVSADPNNEPGNDVDKPDINLEQDYEIFSEKPTILKGIKLPKTREQWLEANLYFTLKLNVDEKIEDLDKYSSNLMQTIYDYFSSNYGFVESAAQNNNDLHLLSVKELKLKLKNMKNEFPENINEIKQISSTIRQKLKSSAKITAPEPPNSNLNGKFYKNFWKSCQEFFESNEGSKPTFSVARCYNYFKSMMCEKIRFKKFKAPSWLQTLDAPSVPFNLDPPSYQEVANAIRKAKAKASLSPLDQISIIVFKDVLFFAPLFID